jgi:hypothetical protein
LKPWTKTMTRRFGTRDTRSCRRASPVLASSLSTLSVTKSVSGLPGNRLGHCTSPTLRRLSGGSEIVIST